MIQKWEMKRFKNEEIKCYKNSTARSGFSVYFSFLEVCFRTQTKTYTFQSGCKKLRPLWEKIKRYKDSSA